MAQFYKIRQSNPFVEKVRDALLRGGRMTKYKGQSASFAPSFIGGVAAASVTLALSGTSVLAGSCTETTPGSGMWNCAGATGADTTQTPTPAAGGALTVTTDTGFGIMTAVGDALTLENAGGDTDITFTDANGSTITGDGHGIYARNLGSGALSVTTTGTVIGGGSSGIRANNGALGTSLTVSAANVTGDNNGIIAYNYGTGALSITSTGTTTGNFDGIFAENSSLGTDLTVMAADATGVTNAGINIRNSGTGALSITSTGTATGDFDGIFARNSTLGTDLTVMAADVTGVTNAGINIRNFGTGALSITSTGTTTGNLDGIFAKNNTLGTDLTIMAAAATGGTNGIAARNLGNGALSVTSTGTTTGTTREGISAWNYGSDLNVTVADIIGGRIGVEAENRGSGALSVTTTGTVTGITGHGMTAWNYGTASELSVIAADVYGGSMGVNAHNRGSGALNVTTTGTVIGYTNNGIEAWNYGNSTDLNLTVADVTGGASGIDAQSRGSGALSLTANGTVRGDTGNGIFARNFSAGTDLSITTAVVAGETNGIEVRNDGSGALNVTTTGVVTGNTGDGISARNFGRAGLTISADSDVMGNGNHGIYAYNSANDVTASMIINQAAGTITTGAVDGINANNLGGSLTINALGSSIGTANDGIHAVNNVAGTTTSTITANNVSGGNNGIFASNNPTGLQNIAVTGTVTGGTGYGIATYTTLAGMTNITLNSGAVVFSGAGLGISNDDGDSTTTINNGALVAGNIVLGDGSDNLTFDGANFTGVTLFDGGDDTDTGDGFTDVLAFSGSSGSLVGANVQNWESVVIGAGSTISFSDNMLTAGTLFTAGTGILDAAGSALAITGNLTNSGLVSMSNGAAGDAALVSGNYTGAGMLSVDVDFAGDASDQLVVNGDVVSGTTTSIAVTDITAGVASGNDVLVVDVTGTTLASDFALSGGAVTSGAFTYDLELQGTQFFLAGNVNSTGAVYEAAPAALLGFSNLPTLEQRVGERQQLPGQAVWLRIHGGTLDTAPASSTSGNTSVDSTLFGLQAGIDIPFDNEGAGDWVLGITAQYSSIDTSVANALGSGSIKAKAYGLGATATWQGSDGIYFDTQAQVNWIDSDISSTSAGVLIAGQNSTAYALSLEMGQRIALNNGNGTLVPQAQLTMSKIDGGSFTDTAGNVVDLGANTTTIGRIGLAYELDKKAHGQRFYVIGNILHNFLGSSSVRVSNSTLTANGEATWAEIGMGGSYQVSDSTMLYGEALYSTSISGNAGNNYGLSATAGLRIQW